MALVATMKSKYLFYVKRSVSALFSLDYFGMFARIENPIFFINFSSLFFYFLLDFFFFFLIIIINICSSNNKNFIFFSRHFLFFVADYQTHKEAETKQQLSKLIKTLHF